MEIWNLVFIQDQVDAHARRRRAACPARTSTRDPRSSASRWCCRASTTSSRPTCSAPRWRRPRRSRARRHGEDPPGRRVAEDRRRARPRHDVPDRRRCAAVERGPRLHPATHAAPRGLARAPAGHQRARCSSRSSRRWSTGSATAYPELRENEAFIRQVAGSEEERFSATLDKGIGLFEEARDRASGRPHLGRRRVRALGHLRRSRASRSRSGPPKPGSPWTWTGSRALLEEQRARARAAREEGRGRPRGRRRAADASSSATPSRGRLADRAAPR